MRPCICGSGGICTERDQSYCIMRERGMSPVGMVQEYHGDNPCLPAWAMRELCRRIAERRIAADRKEEGL
jgi:hypothetical protein